MKMTIKNGDTVYVITGKDKGKTGKVSAVYSDKNKVLVENVNIVTKHKKPKSQQDKGGIVKKPAPIDASNVMVVCPVCNKATRIAHKEIDGKKARVCKKCGASLDKEFVKQTKKEAKKNVKAESVKAEPKTTKKAPAKKAETKVEEKVEKKETKTATKKASGTKTTTQKSNTKKTSSEG